jgi:hypothetical protein
LKDLLVTALLPGTRSAELRVALAERGDASARKFGKFLRRGLGHDIAGFLLASAGRDRRGLLWRVMRP